jgi:transposase InsO family protein
MLALLRTLGFWVGDLLKSRRRLQAENLFLRHQLNIALRKAPPRPRLRGIDRALLVWMTRFYPELINWAQVVKPETILRWHRAGFKAFWRWKSRMRAGRPKIDRGLRDLIQRTSQENPLWGAPRIHGELLMLGFDVAQSTVSKYMLRRRSPPSQSWKTFLRNHAHAIAAIDMCVVPTLTFERLFALLILGHGRRHLLWFEVTRHPTAEWLARQITEAFPWVSAPTYLVRDNDGAYGHVFTRRLRAMGIRDRPISPGSPWQNGYAERLIGTVRRECLDHVLIIGAGHLRHLLALYAAYYNAASYCLSLYVIDANRSGSRFCCPAGVEWRLRARSTRCLAASVWRAERLNSQGPSCNGCNASISPCSVARRRVFGLMPRKVAACVRFIQPSASRVWELQMGIS